ncbi:hypothetical protein [Dermatophilus congolensis]|uniref:hypothetical protein n=1 Tax=Dermatophilus congolensis TaxID=1863 RepID=UPI001AAE6C19|nr:hypothetical protein [Dermatophilus congolensis]MBO3129595.1 hypothetical protein [Dermatophilus congolensis]MBO3131772.1 hypothetical protein [Dermatophilus congolensis]MBO3134071.1 hypothetical protein [Dermatophilus congolensis]MBO3136303.1 hypothetical protein [Dermatophilus congolensis]MBO3140785.1 hypothetical protein [Dermatophilus congolensis]
MSVNESVVAGGGARSSWVGCEVRRVLQQPYVRWLIFAAFVVGVAFQGTRLNQFQNSMEIFDSAVQFSAKNGETLQDALSRPVVVQEDAHTIHIENSLRYDFEKSSHCMEVPFPGVRSSG